jgi:hypothetical protein
MKYELKRGSKGNLMVKVTFEDESNFDSKNLTWIPTLQEVQDVYEAVKMAHDFDKLRKSGNLNLPEL